MKQGHRPEKIDLVSSLLAFPNVAMLRPQREKERRKREKSRVLARSPLLARDATTSNSSSSFVFVQIASLSLVRIYIRNFIAYNIYFVFGIFQCPGLNVGCATNDDGQVSIVERYLSPKGHHHAGRFRGEWRRREYKSRFELFAKAI